jgi:hypothetical protein
MVIFLDFEKAFDSIEWAFLEKSLQVFGFGANFVNWVNILYTNINSSVINNGRTTDYFPLERGIRQGCPLSVYLFLLAVELLATHIRNNGEIEGITVFETCVKVIQMADDTTAFLKDTKSLKALLQSLFMFAKASGLKLNKTKTEALWLGSQEGSEEEPCGIKWVTQSYSLGFWFITDSEERLSRNFAEKFDRFSRALNMWRGRELSLKGKITVVKNIAMPVLLYATSNLPIPEGLIDQVNREVYKFIWNNKPDKISRDTLKSDIQHGGLKMIDFEHMFKAQKIMWIKRLLSGKMSSWKAYVLGKLAPLGTDLFRCSFAPNFIPLDLPLFYHQVMYAWGECNSITSPADVWDVRRESVFFNRHVTIGGNYIGLRWLSWYRKGIFLIHDILDKNGDFLSVQELKMKYNLKTDVLTYNSLKDAIPIQWRRLLRNRVVERGAISQDECICLCLNNITKPVTLLTNNDAYKLLQSQNHILPKCQARWVAQFPDYNFQWADIYKLPFESVRCTKIQALQFKIVHRIYPCNYWVAKWEPNTLETCAECHNVDDLVHYFYQCESVNRFWLQFSTWWSRNIGEPLYLTETDVLFGFFGVSKWIKAVNYCILQAKVFIVKCKYRSDNLFLFTFLICLKHQLSLEKFVHCRNDTVEYFDTTLGCLLNYLE